MVCFSHTVNFLILLFCLALVRGAAGMDDAFGPDTPARRILGCVYDAILITSLYALIRPVFRAPTIAGKIALVLFPLQIIYKLAAAFAVGLHNTVVPTSLCGIALHCTTLVVLLRPV